MRFSKEPVVWVAAVIAALAIVKNILLHEPLTEAIVEPAIVAISAVIVRQNVKPVKAPAKEE